MKDKIYYFDGYHGGQEGHMPLGAFRTILDLLDEKKEWKVSFDVEPESWKLLKFRDPQTFYRLIGKLKEKNAQVEIVGESYSQPISCALNGESVIRNFVYGRETLKKNLGNVKVKNFFSQEPTFTSCMPQILLSLGYKHASLFNSTIFAGYTEGVNSALVKWVGNDGSVIPAIPTYSVNEIVKHENNGSVWWSFCNFFAPPEYVKTCYAAGIKTPSAMGLQDLGYNAEFAPEAKRDGVDRSYLEYATPKQYFNSVNCADTPELSGQELIRVSLPWSEKMLSGYLKIARKYEYALLSAELLNFYSSLYFGKNREKDIRDCWKRFMLITHHDVFVCTKQSFTESMRYQSVALDNNYREIRSDLKSALTDDRKKDLTVTVFNPLSRSLRRLVVLDLALDRSAHSCKVLADGKEIKADFFEHAISTIGAEPLDAGSHMQNDCHKKIVFYSDFKPFEFKEFTIIPTDCKTEAKTTLIERVGDTVVFENELVKVTVDLNRGGCISSYYDKVKSFEYVKQGGAFNELRGFFDAENKFVSSFDSNASIVSLDSGENVALLKLKMQVGSAKVITEYSFYKENAYIDVKTTVLCSNGTKIGDPYKTDDWYDIHRTFYDIKYGFNAYFKTSFEQKYLDKHCAFDVCRTNNTDTCYNNVKDIKHNIAVNWLDVTDGQRGLAVFVNRTTAYVKENESETGISLLWGTDCSCIWKSDVSGITRTETYRVFPHEGTWEDADIWGENDIFNRKPCAFVGKAKFGFAPPFVVNTEKIEVSAAFVEYGHYYIRLFNYGESRPVIIQLSKEFIGVTPCSHDKRINGEPVLKSASDLIGFDMRRFEIKTLRLIKAEKQKRRK